MVKETALTELIREFPGDRAESQWLDSLELLRRALSESLQTDAQLGSYTIDDFPGYASAGGSARVRGKEPLPGLESDCWEGIVGWSGKFAESNRRG